MNFQFVKNLASPLVLRLGLLLLVILNTESLQAQTSVWQGGSGDWTSFNWNTGIPNQRGPDSASIDAIINNVGGVASVVTLNARRTVKNLTVGSGATLTIANSRSLTLAGTSLTNNGTINIVGPSVNTDLILGTGVIISGTGEIVMGNHASNQILNSGTGFTNGATHTIRGAGNILDNNGGMTNLGTIIADQTNALTIDPGTTLTNQGTIRATGTGGLNLLAGSYANTGGLIEVYNGSSLTLTGAAVTGGTLQTYGTGVINAGASTSFTDVTFGSGTLVTQANGISTSVAGTLVNNGVWRLNSTGTATAISFVDGALLSGTGSIVLGNFSTNRLLNSGSSFSNGASHTIQGAGNLLNNVGGMTNLGTILADQSVALTIDPSTTFSNPGTIRSTGTGGLILAAGTHDMTGIVHSLGGPITFQSGANVNQISGGILSSGDWRSIQSGTAGSIEVTTGSPITTIGPGAKVTLSGASSSFSVGGTTLDNSLTANQGTFSIQNGRDFNTVGAFANSGTVNIEGTTSRLDVLGAYTQTAGKTTLSGGTVSGPSLNFSAGKLQGNGTVSGPTQFSSTSEILPGTPTGIINLIGNTSLNGTVSMSIAGRLVDGAAQNSGVGNRGLNTSTTEYDQVNVTGTATLNTGLTFDFTRINGFTAVAGDFFDFFTASTISLTSLNDYNFILPSQNGIAFQVVFLDNITDGTNPLGTLDVLRLVASQGPVVPEPTSFTLAFAGAVLAGVVRWRKRNVLLRTGM